MLPVLVVLAVVALLAVLQVRRRGSRLMRADNAPPGRAPATVDGTDRDEATP